MTIFAWDGKSEYARQSYKQIWIDGKQFLATTPAHWAQIMAATGHDSTYLCFMESRNPTKPDCYIVGKPPIDLEDGDKFYCVPETIG